jgi:Tfp pilus assembly PilM family ATPase
MPDKLEGKIVQAIDTTLDGFASELAKSIKFFQSRYTSLQVGNVLLSGYAGTIPGLDQYIANKTGVQTSVANPWQFVAVPQNDQNLTAATAEFAVAVGLAQRSAGL